MDFDEMEEEDDGHEIVIVVRFTTKAGEDHKEKFTEAHGKILDMMGDIDISSTIDGIPVDEEGDLLF
jgi:hypothetical protein